MPFSSLGVRLWKANKEKAILSYLKVFSLLFITSASFYLLKDSLVITAENIKGTYKSKKENLLIKVIFEKNEYQIKAYSSSLFKCSGKWGYKSRKENYIYLEDVQFALIANKLRFECSKGATIKLKIKPSLSKVNTLVLEEIHNHFLLVKEK